MALDIKAGSSLISDTTEVPDHFDHCVSEKLIFYDPAPRIVNATSGGYKLEFRVTNALKKKPKSPDSDSSEFHGSKKLIPGSDINVSGFEIGTINDTHLLSYNMFSVYRPHMLLLTQNGYRRQHERLDLEDFAAIHTLLTSTTGLLVFYNCRPEAGCSRMHKHMQAIKQTDFSPWENLAGEEKTNRPFQFFRHDFGLDFPPPNNILQIYQGLMREAEKASGWFTEDGVAPPHNVLLDQASIVVIPRRQVGVGRLTLNAAGMLGMIWIAEDDHLSEWRAEESTAWNVLSSAGVPYSNE